MAEKRKILYIVEAMGGGVFTYIVDLANELVNTYDMYVAYAVRKQMPSNVIGNRDVIHSGENGFVCNEIEDYTEAIEQAGCEEHKEIESDNEENARNNAIENTGNNAEKLAEQAWQDVLKMYNTKVMAKQYSKKYEMTISEGARHDLRLHTPPGDLIVGCAKVNGCLDANVYVLTINNIATSYVTARAVA